MNLETILAGYKVRCEAATIDLPIAVNNDVTQTLIDSMTPDRGYASSVSNTSAVVNPVLEDNKRLLQVIEKLREQRLSFGRPKYQERCDAALVEILTRKKTND